jgi:ABC-2 type transport system permease protein/oleandomycin transport system permease protein
MSASDVAISPPVDEVEERGGHDVPTGAVWMWRDSWTEALRHLRSMPRSPDILVFAAIQPIMFVLLFVYVFGSSVKVPGGDYTQYVMAGIFAQTVVFGTTFTSLGLADDLSKGIIDRLRSLPMFQPAVLFGRSISDLVRNIFTFAVMLAVAFAIGWSIQGSLGEALLATLVLLGFGYALSWIQALIGVSVSSVEVANSAGFLWMFPMTFISSAFVDPANMPGWLEAIADANPFSIVTDVSRDLYDGVDPGSDLWVAIAWIVGITIVFAYLAIRKYASATSR